MFGSAMSTIISVLDKSSQGGRQLVGTLMAVAGAVKIVGALMM
jgi:hypothetical protein